MRWGLGELCAAAAAAAEAGRCLLVCCVRPCLHFSHKYILRSILQAPDEIIVQEPTESKENGWRLDETQIYFLEF